MKTLAMVAAAMMISGSVFASEDVINNLVSAADGDVDHPSLYTGQDDDRTVSAPTIGSSMGDSAIDLFTDGVD